MATFLVTGSNRGIGFSLCQRLKARGDSVIATCRKASPELASLGVRIEEGVDVRKDQDVASLRERLGSTELDGLILNAGILRENTLDNLLVDEIRQQFEINALAPLRVVAALMGSLKRGSKVALITSRMGSIADNSSGAYYGYRMSKAALNAAGKSLSIDLRPRGVAVTILHPGYVRTEMTAMAGSLAPDESARLLLARIDELTLASSGGFWHADGQPLPW